jgi:hypothetical protein
MKIKAFLARVTYSIISTVRAVNAWLIAHPAADRAFHTAWQVASAYFAAHILAAHSAAEVQLTIAGAVGAGLAAIRTQIVPVLLSLALGRKS